MRTVAALILGGALLAGCSNELKVTECEPAQGTPAGGEDIIIKGNGFQPGRQGATVRFGRREATGVAVASDSKIKVVSPSGDPNTTVDISVVFDDGKAFVIKNGFRYIAINNRATMDKAFETLSGSKKEEEKK